MNENAPRTWPEKYQDLSGRIPSDVFLSERIAEPLLEIRRTEDRYEAVLCGARKLRGKETIVEAQSLSHNWVLDGGVIRPLPRDIGASLNEAFGSIDLRSLSFADVLAVARTDQDLIRIELAADVLTPARDAATGISDTSKIPGLKAELYAYQADGVAWMHQALRHTGGLILADEMGLGKTIQIISLLLLTPPTNGAPALIICPTSLISNWQREIFRFAPELSVMVHRGAHRAGIFRDLQVAQIIITTYDTAVNDISIFSAFEWGWVICDEAQAIKNPRSARRQALTTIPRVRTIPMTGTPVENTLLDLWSLADFAVPGLLGTQDQFEAEYPDGEEAARALNAITGPIVLRRMVEDVAGDLPERIDVDLPIGLGDDLAAEYERIREETLEKYPVAGALVATGQLQMFCAHPWLQAHKPSDEFWEDEVTVARRADFSLITPKIERTIAIIREAFANGRKVLVFSVFNRCGLTPPTNGAPALIICPTSLISNWQREIFRFAPELSVMVHRGAHRAGIFRDLQVAQIIITTYDTAVNDISIFSAFEWGWVICDEAQAIKNPRSARRQALTTIPRVRTIPMTGTPVENTLLDLWSLADFAVPGLLGTQDQFEAEYPDGEEAARALNAITGPIVLRRMVEDVAGDLPERIDVDLPIGLGDDLAAEYERIREETLEKYPVAGALVATGQLQMFCAHPWLQAHKPSDEFWEDEVTVARRADFSLITPKIERTIAIIREAFANGRKVLVFSVFNRCGDLIRDALGEERDVLWGAINGSTPQEGRQALVDEFSEHGGKACLILNPRAAGTGLNITAATVVVHFTQVWNPALESQASARAHRRGQTDPVTVYRLYYEDTVESVMIDRSQWKRDLGNEAVPISTRDDTDLKRALQISPGKRND